MSNPFEGPAVVNYLGGPERQVPGYDGLLRMTTLLLAEKAAGNSNILVLGAGGGLETRAMAAAQPGWNFEGVDPSQDMLDLAKVIVGEYADRVSFRTGYIESASDGPFDAATCILTMHFVPREQRLETLRQIRNRLKPGSAFVMAHISFPQNEPDRSLWINRHVAYAETPADKVESAKQAVATQLTILSPDEEESLLQQAGFSGVTLFYVGLSLRGWVAYAE